MTLATDLTTNKNLIIWFGNFNLYQPLWQIMGDDPYTAIVKLKKYSAFTSFLQISVNRRNLVLYCKHYFCLLTIQMGEKCFLNYFVHLWLLNFYRQLVNNQNYHPRWLVEYFHFSQLISKVFYLLLVNESIDG